MAFVVKVDGTGHFTFHQSPDRNLHLDSLLHKGQREPFWQYVQARHQLPASLGKHLKRTLRIETWPGLLLWCLCCCWCCDQDSWDHDRDPDLLAQHINAQLAGILEAAQYELLDHSQANAAWREGRGVLKLWLKDPTRYEA